MKVLGQNIPKTMKQTTQSVAQRIAQENLELLKRAKEQVVQSPEIPSELPQPQVEQQPAGTEQSRSNQENYLDLEARSKAESKRLLDALEAELLQIRRQREMRDQQRNQQLEMQNQQTASKPQGEVYLPSSGKPKGGGVRGKMGAVKKKLTDLASRGEKQRNVSG